MCHQSISTFRSRCRHVSYFAHHLQQIKKQLLNNAVQHTLSIPPFVVSLMGEKYAHFTPFFLSGGLSLRLVVYMFFSCKNMCELKEK